jgi:hypothetical protein
MLTPRRGEAQCLPAQPREEYMQGVRGTGGHPRTSASGAGARNAAQTRLSRCQMFRISGRGLDGLGEGADVVSDRGGTYEKELARYKLCHDGKALLGCIWS